MKPLALSALCVPIAERAAGDAHWQVRETNARTKIRGACSVDEADLFQDGVGGRRGVGWYKVGGKGAVRAGGFWLSASLSSLLRNSLLLISCLSTCFHSHDVWIV
jgi:hypothetical protein